MMSRCVIHWCVCVCSGGGGVFVVVVVVVVGGGGGGRDGSADVNDSGGDGCLSMLCSFYWYFCLE